MVEQNWFRNQNILLGSIFAFSKTTLCCFSPVNIEPSRWFAIHLETTFTLSPEQRVSNLLHCDLSNVWSYNRPTYVLWVTSCLTQQDHIYNIPRFWCGGKSWIIRHVGCLLSIHRIVYVKNTSFQTHNIYGNPLGTFPYQCIKRQCSSICNHFASCVRLMFINSKVNKLYIIAANWQVIGTNKYIVGLHYDSPLVSVGQAELRPWTGNRARLAILV